MSEYVRPHPAIPDEEPTRADCEPNSLLDAPDARLRPDPWAEHTCPACGEREDQMPETCRNCGWRNYGSAS